MPIHFEHPVSSQAVTISLKDTSTVISPRYGESYSFDRAGRLLSLFIQGRSIQRTLDHRLLVRKQDAQTADHDSAAGSRRVELPATERDVVLAQTFEVLQTLYNALPQAAIGPQEHRAVRTELDIILRMNLAALAEDGERFRSLFLPVSILPPDQYLSLVVQATEGCSWNQCTFCGLYRDRRFRIRGVDEFRAHCQAVRDFFGAGLSLRRGLFLADANALITPQKRLRELIEVAQGVFHENGRPRPLFAFITAFDADRKSAADWAALREQGLQRVYIGLETGDDALLRFVNKPGSAAQAIQTVADLKAAGIAVGVIAMIGLGGDRFAAQHSANTIKTISAMPLDQNDVIYLSPYRPAPLTPYPSQITAAGIRALTGAEEKAQHRAIQAALRKACPQTRVAPYQVDGFAL